MIVRDLSHPLSSGMPVYPGDPQVELCPALRLDDDGVAVLLLRLGSHSGTHVDAPSHVIPGGASIDAIPLDRFTGRARVLTARGVAARQVITPHQLDLTPVEPGDIALVATGWDAHFGFPAYLEHPFLDVEIAHELVARGVAAIGVDTLNPDETPPDSPAASDAGGFPFHEVFLGAGGIIYENLTGLSSLPATVSFAGVPLHIHAGDGSPVRAYATFTDDTRSPR